jgi:LacI family transcriptional regulator
VSAEKDPYKTVTSMREIAQRLGVTHATVSMALRDDSRISLQRRRQIKAYAAKVGYRPDPLLQQLAAYRKGQRILPLESCIAWLNDWSRPEDYHQRREFHNYWLGAVAAAERLGYRLEEFALRKVAPDWQALSRILVARGIRGVVIPPHSAPFRFASANWSDVAVVKIGFSINDLPVHTAGADQYAGGRMAATNMLRAGRQRIGCVISDVLERSTRGNFTAGFLHARDSHVAKKYRIPPLVLGLADLRKAEKVFLEWLDRNQPDAILFSPANVVRWVKESRRSIPDNVALAAISISDSPINSGLDQLPQEIGRAAIELVTSLIIQRQFGLPEICRRMLIDPVWHAGEECPIEQEEAAGHPGLPK